MNEYRKLHFILFIQCISLLLHANFASTIESNWVDTLPFFTDPENRTLANVVVDSEGNVFVAGTNVLHRFSQDLELKETVTTGPLMDNPECMHPSYPCSEKKVSTDNENHLLVMIDHLESKPSLLICGSVYRRLCQIRPVDNLTEYHWVHPFNQSLGYSSGPFFNVVFHGRGYNDQQALFIAATDNVQERTRAAPFLTSKVIEKDGDHYFFRYAFQNDTAKSAMHFKESNERFVVDGGLEHDGFVYFLFLDSASKLARVCTRDGTFQSYAELTIACEDRFGQINLAFSLHLDDSWSSKGKSLYVTFTRREGENAGTALCIFPMKDVVHAFTKFPRNCLHAVGHTCQQKIKENINDFCGSNVSPYTVSRPLIVRYFTFIPKVIYTAISTIKQYDGMVAIVGAKSGYLIKISLISGQVISVNDMMDANTTGTFRSPFVFDRSKKHIYALIKNKVVKYPVSTCSVHRTCEHCLTRGVKEDPLKCGWCAGRCSHLQECAELGSFSQDTCTPSISKVSPERGPIQGGIKIKITGDSLGSYIDDDHNLIKVAGIPCVVFDWQNREVTCTLGPAPNETSGPVELHVITPFSSSIGYSVAGSTVSHLNFSYYVGPRLFGIRPNKGPTSGGTHVTLFGDNLDFEKGKLGRHFIVRGRICSDAPFRFNKTMGWCVTEDKVKPDLPNKIAIVVGAITYVMEDNPPPTFNHTDVYQSFEYTPDPEIHGLQPGITTVSGLMNVTVSGRYLDSVRSPKIVVRVSVPNSIMVLEFQKDCWTNPEFVGTKLTCSTPSLVDQPYLPIPTRNHPLLTHVSFIMDGVQSLREFPKHQELMSRLLYYPDPELRPFKHSEKIAEDQTTLEIKGYHLDLLRSADNFQIKLGEEKSCKITSFSSELLVCDLPSNLKNSSMSGTNISVEVFMGSTSQHLGFIEIMPMEQEQDVVWGLILLAICVLALFSVIVVAFLCVRKLRKNKHVRSIHNLALSDRPAASHDYRPVPAGAAPPANRQLSQTSCTASLLDNQFEEASFLDRDTLLLLEQQGLLIQREELTFGDPIGEGHFGQVFKGSLNRPNEEKVEIALKTLRRHVWSDATKAKIFMQEALIMKDFNHPHVLCLKGICFEGRVPYMVLDYMENGDLCSYIRDEDTPRLLVSDLLQFGLDIASGMCYLATAKFVHRDLAARNCVLNSSLRAKVADFGLSRDIYVGNYYRSGNEDAELPHRWMAPEAIDKGIYTTNSDVWSYGVLLWELMTRGSIPYANVAANWDVLPYIKLGKRLDQPRYCPESLYFVMLACWNTDPNLRPDFTKLHSYVKEIQIRLLNDTLEEADTSSETPAEVGNSSATVAENSMYCNTSVPAQNTDYLPSEDLYRQMDGQELRINCLRKM